MSSDTRAAIQQAANCSRSLARRSARMGTVTRSQKPLRRVIGTAVSFSHLWGRGACIECRGKSSPPRCFRPDKSALACPLNSDVVVSFGSRPFHPSFGRSSRDVPSRPSLARFCFRVCARGSRHSRDVYRRAPYDLPANRVSGVFTRSPIRRETRIDSRIIVYFRRASFIPGEKASDRSS